MAVIRLGTVWVLCVAAWTATADAASFPCRTPFLGPAETTICQDAQLSKLDEDTARKASSLLTRLSYGQYLGLRYWQSRGVETREQCGPDRACLTAHYRAQNRFLDRLGQCLDGGTNRRTCWRTTLGGSVALPR